MSSHVDALVLAQSTLRLLKLTQSASALTFSSFLLLHLSAPAIGALAPSTKVESIASGFMVLGRVYYQESLESIIIWSSLSVHVTSGILGRLIRGWERKERRVRRREGIRRELNDKYSLVQLDEVEVEGEGEGEGTQVIETASIGVAPAHLAIDVTAEHGDDDDLGPEEAAPPTPVLPVSPTFASTPSSSTSTPSFLGPLTIHHITGYVLLPLALHHSYLHRILPATASAPYTSLSPTLLS